MSACLLIVRLDDGYKRGFDGKDGYKQANAPGTLDDPTSTNCWASTIQPSQATDLSPDVAHDFFQARLIFRVEEIIGIKGPYI